MYHPLANALVVIDVQEQQARDDIARKIHEFLTTHDEEYKVIVGTKYSPERHFHPLLEELPEYFDGVFWGYPGSGYIRTALENANGEQFYDYLHRIGVGKVDLVGINVTPMAREIADFGFNTSVLAQFCEGELSASDLMDLAQRAISVEGWTN